MAIQFLNADLEITSDRPLDVIRDALLRQEMDFSEMYCGEVGPGAYLASFEVSPEYDALWHTGETGREATAQEKVDAFCAVISQFSGALRQTWDQASSRVIDVGYQSDDLCIPLRDALQASTLGRMAELNIDLVVTVYPMTIKNSDEGVR